MYDPYREAHPDYEIQPLIRHNRRNDSGLQAYHLNGLNSIFRDRKRILLIANLNTTSQTASVEVFGGAWHKILDSAEEKWRGPGTLLDDELDGRECDRIKLAPRSVALFHCQRTSL